MEEYRGVVYSRNGRIIYRTTVYGNGSMDARYAVAREYQNLHPKWTIDDILRQVSVQKIRFGVTEVGW